MSEETTPGEWQVADRCTACDVARQTAPGLIAQGPDGRSVMARQPRTDEDVAALVAAAFTCPVGAIQPVGRRLEQAEDPYPIALDDTVHLCGHNSPITAGAKSYLLRRSTGFVMIDTPLFSRAIADRYSALGPITDVLLTHRDHAMHGESYAAHLGARLWIHEGDLDAAPGADQVLRGTESVEVAEGVVAHPLYGHTEGNVVYVADDTYCFAGDSFRWSRTKSDIDVFETVTWLSIRDLAASMRRVVPQLTFEWLLPGHGEGIRLPRDEMAARMAAMVERTSLLTPQTVDFFAVEY